MVTTAGKVVIMVGFLVFFTGMFVTMSTIVGLFMIFAGIITMIQGANMKPIQVNPAPKEDIKKIDLGDTTSLPIKKDPNNKGAI